MRAVDLCKPRIIKTVDVKTPLIVPSFSSKGFPRVRDIHRFAKDFLVDAALVSAYDLHYGFLKEHDIYSSDVVFVDSGGYESKQNQELSELHYSDYHPKAWSEEDYIAQIHRLEPLSSIVLVNFDISKRQSLAVQIQNAKELFNIFPNYVTDFLCKPNKTSNFIDVVEILENIQLLSQFSIIGFTEKELGASLFQRCKNLCNIRATMASKNLYMPIHIFGCIDPLTTLAYFLCGADIFDGLSWLRFGFHNYLATYRNNQLFLDKGWEALDVVNQLKIYCNNLLVLMKLMENMRCFTKTHNISAFGVPEPLKEHLLELLRAVGVTV